MRAQEGRGGPMRAQGPLWPPPWYRPWDANSWGNVEAFVSVKPGMFFIEFITSVASLTSHVNRVVINSLIN